MNPEHAAARSNPGTPGNPRLCATKHAVDGKIISGVTVAQMISSMSFASKPAAAIALRAAAVARVAVDSPSETMRRSRMPVRWTIHSSLVSTIFARSSLVNRLSGNWLPVPTMLAPRVGIDSGRAVSYEGLILDDRDAMFNALNDFFVDAGVGQLLADPDGVADS